LPFAIGQHKLTGDLRSQLVEIEGIVPMRAYKDNGRAKMVRKLLDGLFTEDDPFLEVTHYQNIEFIFTKTTAKLNILVSHAKPEAHVHKVR
jgi:hypothetical protein